VPLTINMITDPTNAYYAFGGTSTNFSGPAYNPANQPLNGSPLGGQANTTPYLKNALSSFQFGHAI